MNFLKPENNKLLLKRLRLYGIPGVLLVLLLVMAGFAERKQKNLRCEGIQVNISNQHIKFLSPEGAIFIITDRNTQPLNGKPVKNINLRQLEAQLLKNSYVKSAELYFNMNGNLHIDIEQRQPVVRIIRADNSSYYLDESSHRMPVTTAFTPHVPVVVSQTLLNRSNKDSLGHLLDEQILCLISYMNKDAFAEALAGQVIVEGTDQFTIIPRLGNFEIFLGDTTLLENKFSRLKAFYKKSLPAEGWDKYKHINLNYKNQIIANR